MALVDVLPDISHLDSAVRGKRLPTITGIINNDNISLKAHQFLIGYPLLMKSGIVNRNFLVPILCPI